MIKPKILVIIGTRPEATKMAPVILELQKHSDTIQTQLITSGQHKDMVNDVLAYFLLKQDKDLNLMTQNQSLSDINSRVLSLLDPILKNEKPDLLLVHGDTTTAMSAAMCGFYNNISVAHVEAGLRTHDLHNPYPEEMNRCVIDMVSDLLFAPTEGARQNLINEGKSDESIFVTGNTGIDTLFLTLDRETRFSSPPLQNLDFSKKIILLTTHRRENFGQTLERIHLTIREELEKNKDATLIMPVHPNPNVKSTVEKIWLSCRQAILTTPLSYTDMIGVLKQVHLVVTDSGGLQEEAASLNIPVLVVRSLTERPEGILNSSAVLVGTDPQILRQEMAKILDKPKQPIEKKTIYGDGQAAKRIVKILRERYVK